jgi:hypothetical protein
MLETSASTGRLPSAVLRSNGALPLCQPVLIQYHDSGLFGIHAACRPNDSAKAISMVTDELVSLAQTVRFCNFCRSLSRALSHQTNTSLVQLLQSTADLEIELAAAKQFTLDTLDAKFTDQHWLASEIGYRSLFRPDCASPVLDMQYERAVIEKIDASAIRKLVESMLSSRPTVFSFGSVPGNAPIMPALKAQLEAASRRLV